MHLLHLNTKPKTWGEKWGSSSLSFWEDFREREDFSLEIQAIQPLAVFGTRSKTALRGEGVEWVPDLWSFLKLQEVGFSLYLGFIPIFSTFRMFRLIEALNGRLIGPKAWD